MGRVGGESEREEGYAHGKRWSRARTPLVFAFCRQREGTGALVFFFPGGNNRKREEVDKCARANSLEALAVNDRRARLVVLLLRDPHLLEGRQRREDRATDPDRVLALGRRDNLDLHGRGGERRNLLLHAVRDARVHGRASRHDNVAVQVLADVEVALHDRVVRRLVDTGRLESDQTRLEERLRSTEPLVTDRDDLAVRELVRLLERRRLRGGLHLLLKVEGDVAELLLDVADNLALGRGAH